MAPTGWDSPDGGAKVNFTVEESPAGDNQSDELLDITKPFPDLPGLPDEPAQFTIRAVAVGTVLGAVVSASNMYLCLKTGWTFGASLFGMAAQNIEVSAADGRQVRFLASRSSSRPATSYLSFLAEATSDLARMLPYSL